MRIQGQSNDRIGAARGEKSGSSAPSVVDNDDSGGAVVAASVNEVTSISDRITTARAARIQELKAAFESNRYQTDTALLADRILSDEFARNTRFAKQE